MFSGNIVNSSKNNHVFIINEQMFQNYGTVSFSRDGWKEFIKTDLGKKVLSEYTNNSNIANLVANNPDYPIWTALNVGTTGGKYTKYDGEAYVETTISTTDIEELLKYHERGGKKEDGTKDEELDKKIIEINGSNEGYISFKRQAGSEANKVVLRLYFYPSDKQQTRRNDRYGNRS